MALVTAANANGNNQNGNGQHGNNQNGNGQHGQTNHVPDAGSTAALLGLSVALLGIGAAQRRKVNV
jgi:hypothetical protein